MTSVVPSESMRISLETAAKRYQENLTDAPEVLEYLTQERRLTNEALAHFRIGFTGENPRVGDPARRISIPYWSWSGPTQIRFRTVGGEGVGQKYLGSPGASTRLFNTLVLRGDDQTVYVTEGELDCITAWICGLPCVGIPGANSWKKDYWRLFRYRTVVVLADAGEAGEKLAEAVRKDIEDTKVVTMPVDDVNHFFVHNGREALRELVGLK